MKLLIKSCLLQNRAAFYNKSRLTILILSAFYSCFSLKAQEPANYVNNGGFEDYYTHFVYRIPNYWGALDSAGGKYYGELLVYPQKVPYCSYAYQWPKSGRNHLITTPYSNTTFNNRGYPKNKLKSTLVPGKTYCVAMYVNLSNQSTHGISNIAAYFGDSSLDTIKYCDFPITYLTPQVFNPVNNIITDTLNWVPITGTFVANGTEKYLVLGNFKSNANTDTALANPTNLPANVSDYLIDAVSCIDIDLPAYAGPDKAVKPGDSVFIGRQPDVGIDEACRWYKLPTVITPSTPAMDTVAGIWVKPALTSTYVVKQQLWCSGVKYDTVVVFMNYVGLNEQKRNNEEIKIWPNPASDVLYIDCSLQKNTTYNLQVIDLLGQTVKEEEITLENGTTQLNINKLPAGVYFLALKSGNVLSVSYKFVKIKY